MRLDPSLVLADQCSHSGRMRAHFIDYSVEHRSLRLWAHDLEPEDRRDASREANAEQDDGEVQGLLCTPGCLFADREVRPWDLACV